MIESITIEPPMRDWPALIKRQPQGKALGQPLEEWRQIVRDEYNFIEDRPVIATGHQPTLWHPGILAKYLAGDAFRRRVVSNLLDVIVAQDVLPRPAAVEVPFRRADGTLTVRTIDFAANGSVPGRDDVPIVAQPAFNVRPFDLDGEDLLPSVREGLERIHAALLDGSKRQNAAAQMCIALWRLMHECAGLGMMDHAMSTPMRGKLAYAMLLEMAADPRRCVMCYNAAVAAVPEARLTPLVIRDDLVELPLWRVHEDGRRVRGYDSDAEAAIEEYGTPLPQRRVHLMPRALLMTAMLRLAVCDLFIHGTGGAIYDRAMERWIRDWLGVDVAPMATVSATVRLPLMPSEDLARVRDAQVDRMHNRKRWLEHDPQLAAGPESSSRPSAAKRSLLREIDSLPAHSPQRRAAFFEMHRRLAEARRGQAAQALEAATREVERLQQLSRDAQIALRRDWAFPLYPRETLEQLKAAIAG